ncbi:MAG: serine/threonine protein kinase, partial [Deltaproteobacteria bacterium]|nr:serine/threonine protein kinase [Deltaproteobacteria bacterium]
DTVTATDTIVGTPAYMASEQITGQAVDHRTDQFALCVSLFEALYGMHPYQGDTIALQFEQVRTGSIAVPPASTRVPGWLRAVVVRGLHPQPNKRWPSMDALREALGNDPTRARTRLFAGLAGLAALGIATWGGSLMADDRSVPCLDAARHMKPVWDTPQRDAVRETLPTELARNVVPALDRYAQTWMKAHTEACEATQVRGEQSPALLDLRMRCLTRKKRELAAVVEAFAAADPNAVGHALERTRGLSSIAACADAEYLTSQREAPPRHSASSGAAS